MKHSVTNYKVNCSEISAVMSNAKDNNPVPDEKIDDVIIKLDKKGKKLTEAQVVSLKDVVTKVSDYNPKYLSKTARKSLVNFYSRDFFGRGEVSGGGRKPRSLEKGKTQEHLSIKLLSEVTGIEFEKNEKLFQNKFFKGKPDILVRNTKNINTIAIDVKTPVDMPSYIFNVMERNIAPNIYWQAQGYMSIFNINTIDIYQILVNMSDSIIEQEKAKVIENGIKQKLSVSEIEDRLIQVDINMKYDDIEEYGRVFKTTIERNIIDIRDAKNRVLLAREYMEQISNKMSEIGLKKKVVS